MSWSIDSTINDGYPYILGFTGIGIKTGWTNNDVISLPANIWRINADVNEGYPYTWNMIAIQSGYIYNPDVVIGSDIKYKEWEKEHGGGGGGDTENDIGNLTTVLRHGTYTAGCNFYVMTAEQLNALTGFLNTGYQPTDEDFIKDFKGINPFEYITSVLYFPFDIPNIPDILTIKVGSLDTGISTKKLITSYGIDNIYDFGNFNINPYFNDFRDFSPYTTITLQLPFCSSVTLDTGVYMGHSVNVKMVVDYITGNCSCLIYRDELLMSVVNGTIGHSISLTLKSMSDFQNKLQNLSLQRQTNNRNSIFGVGASIGTIAGGVASANPFLIAGGVGGLIKSADTYAQNKSANEYQSSHTVPNVGTTGTNSPINDMVCELLPRIIITRSKTINSDMSLYGKTVGYACNRSGVLSDFDGLTVCATAKLDEIEATETEKEMILNILTSGVYL